MASLVYVRLPDARLLPFSSPEELVRGTQVIVDIDGILEFGTVECLNIESAEPVGEILRVANPEDAEKQERICAFESEDKDVVRENLDRLGIEMKLVAVQRSFDGKKILVMYTAEDRVDFRQLVKDLAGIFRMRVEMRQISERDEAKFRGGCGACGQPLCCRRFLTIPRQTSIKMAKVQGLALTPNKVNGVCGKLMCCLQYEYSQYREVLSKLPSIGSLVETKEGKGEVAYLDLVREKVAVRLNNESHYIVKFDPSEIKVLVEAKAVEDKEGEDDR